MAQKSNKRQPVYSADALALRYLGGLALAALGVMMFLAVGLGLKGNVFDALRRVCYGLTGGLALALPVLPIWGGVLVIWSSQKKAPVKPFVYAALAYLALCGFIVLVTKIGSEEFLSVLSRVSDGSWGGVILQGYVQSYQLRASGGALGVILGFPFWSLVGTILGALVLFLALVFCLLMALGLTPARLRDLATGKGHFSFRRPGKDQASQDERQIAFQQEQERQRQMAYAEQQAYLLQQQQQQQAAAQAARQNSARWQQPAQAEAVAAGASLRQPWPEPTPAPSWTGANSAVTDDSVLDWQQQLTDQKAAGKKGRKSSIFDGPAEEHAANEYPQNPSSEGKESSWASRIFGGRKNQEDGLSDLSQAQKQREGMDYPSGSRLRNSPQSARLASDGPAASDQQETPIGVVRNSRVRAQQQKVEEDLDRWRRPPAQQQRMTLPPEEPETPAASDQWEEQPLEAPSVRKNARAQEKPKAPERESAKATSPWLAKVIAAENAAREEPEEQEAPQPRMERPPREEKPRAEQVPVPVVQPTIADPTWKPELKHVEPKEEEPEEEFWEPTPYYAPPITDLKKPDASVLDTSEEDEERSRRLEATLASFKVQARVVHVTHGPAISRFELELAPGTKVGKVAELEKDIAYGMQATSVRIEAPIPGKALVGVEVPNPKRATVTLREVLESPQMQNAKSILTVALGKDIAGVPIICDLAKMPHMLIAGATGSGKSVCINTIINSLLFRAGPEEVKMILVDPKVVELQCYNGIPHLLLPVVNDPHKASAALAWAVAEMMERYDKFSERGVRNLEGYNGILGPGEKPMPRIVIIIDELADLMMVCKKDVEEYICRLTQLARAAGIHLIVATQRPSVDVITGLIKANIPSRIAFKTASYVDSRTILDRNGSEQLLGWGDMLYLPTGSFAPTRIQGCFLSDEEVNRIADHVRQANPSAYDPDVLDKLEQLTQGQEEGPSMDMIGGAQDSGAGDADLFEQAVEYAIADGQISTSTLQRRLKVGYARAGRLTDEMEERGIVSAKDGSKPRKCLITREQWEEMKAMTTEAS